MNLPYPQAILIDLDDTILELNTSVDKCWKIVCSRFASVTTGLTTEKLLYSIDEIRSWYWNDPERHREGRLKLLDARREMVKVALASLEVDDNALAGAIAVAYGEEMDKHMAPFPGTIETLRHLHRHKLKMALLTNGSSALQRKKIDRFDLAQYFDLILIEEEAGYGKPDQRIFLQALSQLAVDAAEAWMVGDDLERDIAGAQQAGIFTFWVDSKPIQPAIKSEVIPDRTIRSLTELI